MARRKTTRNASTPAAPRRRRASSEPDAGAHLGVTRDAVPSMRDRAADVARRIAEYRELESALDEVIPNAVVAIVDPEMPHQPGRPHRTRAYWAAVEMALGLNVRFIGEESRTIGGVDTLTVHYTARDPATDRSVDGFGACSSTERGIANTYHAVRTQAHIRARSHAIAALFTFASNGGGDAA